MSLFALIKRKYILATERHDGASGRPSDDWKLLQIPDDLKHPKTDREKRLLHIVKELIKTSSKDPMTGLSHKEHFLSEKKDPGVYIYIDGDGLKKMNDQYGHEAGHAAILAIGDAIKKKVREKGTVKTRATRAGGDEFVVHIENVSLANGVAIAKRILESIHAQKISKFYSGPEENKAKLDEIKLSASLGVGTTLEDADKAVYKAKAKGKSRVEWTDPKTKAKPKEQLAAKVTRGGALHARRHQRRSANS